MTPSIEAAKKLASLLDTTVGYLLGESEDHDLFKDPEMLKRFKDLKNIGAKPKVLLSATHQVSSLRWYWGQVGQSPRGSL
ncbi:MAG: hypothetical protein KF763_19920 [Cyclobacteriaceae bacterium]|nr:hypothetical protein [Cyclobacteriaceae bacterium]